MASELKPGTAEYAAHAQAEIKHYSEIFSQAEGSNAAGEALFQPVPATWIEVEHRAADLIRQSTGAEPSGHVISRLNALSEPRMLSLGSGPCGIELEIAARAPGSQITCVDFNQTLLELGQARASAQGLNMAFEQNDLNSISLPSAAFDVVFCHASLHHVIELERLAKEIRHCLRPDGELITVDVITANGYRMWPETRQVVQAMWRTLPARFRLNHTAYAKRQVDEEIWEADTSQSGMECIRSQDILEVLAGTFKIRHFVPYFSICRRFLDTMYGPNYDLANSLDRALLDWIWQLDRHYLSISQLRPETFFGVYTL